MIRKLVFSGQVDVTLKTSLPFSFSFISGFITHLPLVFLIRCRSLLQQLSEWRSVRMKQNIILPYPRWTSACLKIGGEIIYSLSHVNRFLLVLLPQPNVSLFLFSFVRFFQYDEPVVWNQACDVCPVNVNVKRPWSYYILGCFWVT